MLNTNGRPVTLPAASRKWISRDGKTGLFRPGRVKTSNRGFSSIVSTSPVNEPSKLSVYLVFGITGTAFKRPRDAVITSEFTPSTEAIRIFSAWTFPSR